MYSMGADPRAGPDRASILSVPGLLRMSLYEKGTNLIISTKHIASDVIFF
jgi:hypothetical protein